MAFMSTDQNTNEPGAWLEAMVESAVRGILVNHDGSAASIRSVLTCFPRGLGMLVGATTSQ